jgi:hypothetical protein
MAKAKKTNKVSHMSHIKRVATTKVDNRLSFMLIVLALLVFVLAALSMSSKSNNKVVSPTPTLTASPVAKTVKTAK